MIVNVASGQACRPAPRGVAYAAPKAGLVNLTRALTAEWGPVSHPRQHSRARLDGHGPARAVKSDADFAAPARPPRSGARALPTTSPRWCRSCSRRTRPASPAGLRRQRRSSHDLSRAHSGPGSAQWSRRRPGGDHFTTPLPANPHAVIRFRAAPTPPPAPRPPGTAARAGVRWTARCPSAGRPSARTGRARRAERQHPAGHTVTPRADHRPPPPHRLTRPTSGSPRLGRQEPSLNNFPINRKIWP